MADKPVVRPTLLPDPMTSAQFREFRRQRFLTLENFRRNQQWARQCLHSMLNLIAEQKSSGDLDPFGQRGMFLDLLAQVHLLYTAGEPIEAVSVAFDEMFQWFCKWHMDFAPYAVQLRSKFRPDAQPMTAPSNPTPLDFEDIEDFHRAITVVSLAVLLGKPESLQIAADLLHAERGQDMLLEDLLSPTTADRGTTDFYHVRPYDPLIDAYYMATSPDEAIADIRKYLQDWYPAMRACAWHDSHSVQKDHMTPYNGYWSFEAGAICLIHGIDDTSFRDHLVHPKDLVDWARLNDSLGKLRAAAQLDVTERGPRCEGGQPCPREGLWFSPASQDSRRYFKQGEPMPALGGAWGLGPDDLAVGGRVVRSAASPAGCTRREGFSTSRLGGRHASEQTPAVGDGAMRGAGWLRRWRRC